jgi:hypothetical protein
LVEKKTKRAVGKIVIYDTRGYAYIPKIVRNEVGIDGKGTIPFYLDANVVLLIRSGATKNHVLQGLDILKEDLKLRWADPENYTE